MAVQHHRLDPAKHVKTDVDMAACTTRPCHVASLNDLRLTADTHFFLKSLQAKYPTVAP